MNAEAHIVNHYGSEMQMDLEGETYNAGPRSVPRQAFSGNRRVLEHIKLLAENNYGEDDFGNNLHLPLSEELTYLRK